MNTWAYILKVSRRPGCFFLFYNCRRGEPVPGDAPQVWARWNGRMHGWEDVHPTPHALAVREIFWRVHRYIDLDCTIAFRGGSAVAETICGCPLLEFLSEKPFIVHSHGSNAVPFFTEDFPDLPKPEIIIFPPFFRLIGPLALEDDYGGHSGKDFEALGITGAVIIDDMMPYRIHAPGCTVLQPYEGSSYDQLKKILGE